MSREPVCWVCGRTTGEISAVLGDESEDEKKLREEVANATAARDSLREASGRWASELPAAFKDFELAFILQNADQFKSIPFLDKLADLGRGPVRELDEVSSKVRKGEDVHRVGAAPAEKEREFLVGQLNEFEKETKRKLLRADDTKNASYQRLGFMARFQGMKLAEGMEYMSKVGLFYYGLQSALLERAIKAAGVQKKPMWTIRAVKFKEFPKEILVCNVCERLLRELRASAD